MAGGYDERVTENREHFLELKSLASELGIGRNVTFVRSFSGEQKKTLLSSATCLLYTPDQEHFGIVPIEAMFMNCPVIAVRSGGPLETVVDGSTGFLCDPDAELFMDAMEKFLHNPDLSRKMGKAGHERVISRFSFDAFTHKLNGIVMNLCA
jgi:alpha-1,3/alpha-1,6-mannosyltransferase